MSLKQVMKELHVELVVFDHQDSLGFIVTSLHFYAASTL
jgi:hypothetical protein